MITISDDNKHNLEIFTELLQKDENTLINEALNDYFAAQHKKIVEKNIEDENAMTNLDFNEFWDDVDI